MLEALGRVGLRNDAVIAPTGGIDKVVTFVALIGANKLKFAVFHDYAGAPDQRLQDLVREKVLSPRALLDASQFRDLTNVGNSGGATDIEDLFPEALYLEHFNAAYKRDLNGVVVLAADLPPGDRIVKRLEKYLADNGVKLRPSGGFNHYLVASHFASHPPQTLDGGTLDRFEALFKAVNSILD
jgi:hypothetical protein